MSETLKILVALLAIGLATFLVLRFSQSQTPTRSSDQRILYVCDDGDYEICSINIDGSGFTQLTRNTTRDFRISANHNDSLAFLCTRERATSQSQMELCYLDAIRGAVTRLSNLQYSVNFSEYPLLKEDGRIVYVCFDGDVNVEICSINANGSNDRLLTDNRYVEFALAAQSGSDIAFICVRDDAPSFFETEICTVNSNGGNLRVITNNDMQERGVQINTRGVILTNCYEGVIKNLGLCTTTQSRGALDISSYNAVGDAYSMNNSGQIAFQCADSLDAEICVMNANGTGFRQLTRNETDDRMPTISDSGLIAYHCGARICLINFNGTGARTLTSITQLPAVVDQRIGIQ